MLRVAASRLPTRAATLSLSCISLFLRQASTVVVVSSNEIFFPSVLNLIHVHRIPLDVVSTIRRTGPKNRLLKGDVLAFLEGPKNWEPLPEPVRESLPISLPEPAYFSAIISLDAINKYSSSLKSNGIFISDLFVKATALALVEVPEVLQYFNASEGKSVKQSNPSLSTIRLAAGTAAVASFTGELAEIATTSIGKSFKTLDQLPVLSKNAFSVFDQSASPNPLLTPIISPNQCGILVIDALSTPSTVSTPDIDFFFGKSSPKNPVPSVPSGSRKSFDDLDFLGGATSAAVQVGGVEIELVVDRRAVNPATANKFLNVWKSLVEKTPEKVLK
ncbi:hypothetical protein BJ742DRAFT_347695 [Cladochytrium replicatum]|nr:hypothetical protein BJ742DRAFT_347695 [Cladochytrium replicatum]